MPLTLHAYILHCSPEAHATLQDMDYIDTENLWITRAKDKTYIQAVFGTPKKKRLLVEITQKKAKNHLELIELIAEQIKHTKVTKEQVLALRAKVVEHNGE